VILFILILFINIVFWWTWFKLTFNNIYGRLHKCLSRYFSCLRKSKTEDAKDNDLGNADDEAGGPHKEAGDFDEVDDKKKKKKRKHHKSKGFDDSSRYALAADDSNRNVDDSYRQDGSAYIINANKNETRKGKTVSSRDKQDETSSVDQTKT
jgi:hypothetical protein